MKRFVLILPLVLAGCMSDQIDDADRPDGVLPGTPIEMDGMTLVAQQMTDWPMMIAPVNAAGETVVVEQGRADTVLISGSPDSRDRAIKALAEFCERPIDPAGFDTQFVFQDPDTGDWWFDGFCG